MTPLSRAQQPPIASPSPSLTFSELRAGFATPPPSARLRCYWWWLNGNTDEPTITHDLEEMSRMGFGGAILVDANGSEQNGNDPVPPGPTFGSPAWTRLYVHALREAARLHLEISLNIASGWNLGGPGVTPERASKLLTFSRTTINTAVGSPQRLELPAPPQKNGFYRQIAVLAYPLHHGPALPVSPPTTHRENDLGVRPDAAPQPEAASAATPGRPGISGLPFRSAAAETGFSMPDSAALLDEGPAVPGSEDTDTSEIRELSALTRPDGTLDWTPPTAGDWEILRIGYTDSGARVSTSSGAWQGLAIDYLDHTAFDSYWKSTVLPLLNATKPFLGTSLKYLVTDSWELGGTNWTPAFRDQFRKLRGYDPVPFLPVVAGRIVGDRAASVRFLSDLRRTVADLIVTEHYDVFAAHAREFGLGIHPESGGPHGAPIDALETFRSAAFPQTEYWAQSTEHRTADPERFFTKQASSAAHIYGLRFVAQEGMTSIGPQWSESLASDLKPSFDHALTEGMNRLIWHEFTSSPASTGLPGQEYFAGTHLNPKVTWWPVAQPFFAYLNRSQFLLQQGSAVADVLYFYGDTVPNFVRLKADDPAGVLPGYDYDVTGEDALLRTIRISGNTLQTPTGETYRLLALPKSRRISLAALQKIQTFLGSGGSVSGPTPTGPSGIVSPAMYRRLSSLIGEIWQNCSPGTHHPYGRGTVFCTDHARDALAQLQIPPDFTSDPQSTALDYIHRTIPATSGLPPLQPSRSAPAEPPSEPSAPIAPPPSAAPQPSPESSATAQPSGTTPAPAVPPKGTASAAPLPSSGNAAPAAEVPSPASVPNSPRETSPTEIYFIRNSSADSVTTNVTLRAGAKTPELWDAVSGATTPTSYATAGKELISVPLTLPPFGSTFVLLHAPAAPGTRTLPAPVPGAPIDLPGPWQLAFQPNRGAPTTPITLPALTSWTDNPDPAVRFFSGSATYRTTFTAPAHAPADRVYLQFKDIREIARIRINNRPAGTLWAHPLRLRIDRLLRRGPNTLEVEVTDLWPNRIIGDLQPDAPSPHITQTNIRKYTAASPLLPSGLIGPAQLVVEHPGRTRPTPHTPGPRP